MGRHDRDRSRRLNLPLTLVVVEETREEKGGEN